jgi:endo-1,4-beta-xylanase
MGVGKVKASLTVLPNHILERFMKYRKNFTLTLFLLMSILLVESSAQTPTPNQPLRRSAAKKNLYVGAAVAMQPFNSETVYQDTLKREFNILVAENAFKWDALHPGRRNYNFADADALVGFAETNNMEVRGHTLIWHNQLPNWLTTGNFTRDELIAILQDHIQTVVGRYKGRILAWDVVNEAIAADGTYRNESFWFQRLGADYIKLAFQFAHQADPDAKLYYNDFGNEDLNIKSNAIYDLLAGLKNQGVPVHGAGWQMHMVNGFRVPSSFVANAQRLADLGLELSITELDVRTTLPTNAAALQEQAETYRSILDFCLSQPNCKALLTWGFTDKHSWIPGFFVGTGDALPFDKNYQAKPAYTVMQQILQAGLDFTPKITSVTRAKKQLIVSGTDFETGSEILINGAKQKKVSNDPANPTTMLIAAKAGKLVLQGDRIQVRNPDGSISSEFIYQ